MNFERTFHIREPLDGASLSQALIQLLKDKSWSEIKRLLANRHIQVHGNLCCDEGRRLKLGDVVKVFAQPLLKPPEASDLQILFRDEHMLIVEKPAGVTSLRHAEEREISDRRKQTQPTLDELLNARLASRQAKASQNAAGNRHSKFPRPARAPAAVRVRPVHRLDRDTSGLMIFALSAPAEQRLVQMFKTHEIQRVYRAVVLGKCQAMTIETDFVRDRGDGLRGSLARSESEDAARDMQPAATRDAQHAITHVRPIESFAAGGHDYTIVECRLQTGRTHQIRIHLAERGHMLCGEKMYTHLPGQRPTRDPSGAPRQALHSCEVLLPHPITGAEVHFVSRWPAELARWLKQLKSHPMPPADQRTRPENP